MSAYYCRLNITFGGIFLHETAIPSVKLVSFKQENATFSLQSCLVIWRIFDCITGWLRETNQIPAIFSFKTIWPVIMEEESKKYFKKHISKNRQQCRFK